MSHQQGNNKGNKGNDANNKQLHGIESSSGGSSSSSSNSNNNNNNNNNSNSNSNSNSSRRRRKKNSLTSSLPPPSPPPHPLQHPQHPLPLAPRAASVAVALNTQTTPPPPTPPPTPGYTPSLTTVSSSAAAVVDPPPSPSPSSPSASSVPSNKSSNCNTALVVKGKSVKQKRKETELRSVKGLDKETEKVTEKQIDKIVEKRAAEKETEKKPESKTKGLLAIPTSLLTALRGDAQHEGLLSNQQKKVSGHKKKNNNNNGMHSTTSKEQLIEQRPKAYSPEDLVINEVEKRELRSMKALTTYRFFGRQLQDLLNRLKSSKMSKPLEDTNWSELQPLLVSIVGVCEELVDLVTPKELFSSTTPVLSTLVEVISHAVQCKTDKLLLQYIMEECIDFVWKLTGAIQRKITLTEYHDDSFVSSIGAAMRTLGTISKYYAKTIHSEQLLVRSRQYLELAVGLCPTDSFIELMELSIPTNVSESLLWKSRLIHCLRCSCVNSSSSLGNHEFLSEFLEEVRIRATRELQAQKSASSLSFRDHHQKCVMALLATAGVQYTRVEADKFLTYLELFQRHLQCMFQIVQTRSHEELEHKLSKNGVNLRKYKNILQEEELFNRTMNNDSIPDFQCQLQDLESIAYDALMIIFLLAVQLSAKYAFISDICACDNRSNNSIAHELRRCSVEEERFISNSLIHRLKVVPGLMDVLIMFVATVVTMAGGGLSVVNDEDSHVLNRVGVFSKALHLSVFMMESVPVFQVMPLLLNSSNGVSNKLDFEAFMLAINKLRSIGSTCPHCTSSIALSTLPEWLDLIMYPNSNSQWQDTKQCFNRDCFESSRGITAHTQLLLPTPPLSFNYTHTQLRWQRFSESCALLSSKALLLNSGNKFIVFQKLDKKPLICVGGNCDELNSTGLLTIFATEITAKKSSNFCTQRESTSSVGNGEHDNSDLHIMAPLPMSSKKLLVLDEESSQILKAKLKKDNDLYSHQTNDGKRRPISSKSPPLIVIDAANVAMRHGLNENFSCRGIQITMKHFLDRGHRVVAFLPDYYLNYDRVGALKRLNALGLQKNQAAKIPDNIDLLRKLQSEHLLIFTPPQDYDDSYCIDYARRHDGFIVTNDLFRDHVERLKSPNEREASKKWIKDHCISYTFACDEFLPNPESTFIY